MIRLRTDAEVYENGFRWRRLRVSRHGRKAIGWLRRSLRSGAPCITFDTAVVHADIEQCEERSAQAV